MLCASCDIPSDAGVGQSGWSCEFCGGQHLSLATRAEVEQRCARSLALASWCARRFASRLGSRTLHACGGIEELRGEARIALLIAARAWDASRGAKFSTYAVIVISNRLSQWATMQALPCRGGGDRASAPAAALDAVADAKAFEPVAIAALAEERLTVRRAVAKLPGKQGKIVRQRRLEGKTLEAVADAFGLSRERIRQIQALGEAGLAKQLGML